MANLHFVKLILVCSCLPVFAAAIYAGIVYKKLSKQLKLFSVFLFLSAVMQLISGIAWWTKINNLPLLHLYVASGFVCIALFYREVFQHVLNRSVIHVVIILFLLATVILAFPLDHMFRFTSHALSLESLLVIVFSISTFLLLMNEQAEEIMTSDRKSIVWINSGFFIYYTSNLLIFYFGDLFTRLFPVYLNQRTWLLHSFFSVIMYTCFIIALWKRRKS